MLPIPFDNPSTYTDRPHSGVDFGQPKNTTIKASAKGTITYVGWLNDNAGWSVIVQYDNGPEVLYCHQPKKPNVKVGGTVFEGTPIGLVGSSGRSTGPHLHMEIMKGKGAHTYNGVWNYFDRNKVVGDGSSSGDNGTPINSEEDDMPITILTRADSSKTKSVYNINTGKCLRPISAAENNALRAASQGTAVIYIQVSDKEYADKGGF